MNCNVCNAYGNEHLIWNPIPRETCIVPEGFEADVFSLKYQHLTFEYKIHFVEVDLYYLKHL